MDRRLSGGLMVTTSFTYQKAMSYQGSDDGGLMFYIDPQRNYARADFDRTLNFVQSYFYQLPFGPRQRWLSHGFLSQAIGGWKLSSILALRTGAPFTITANNNVNAGNSVSQTANLIAPVTIDGAIGPGHQWFLKGSFQQPTGLLWGTLGRNELTGPGTYGLNVALSKTFKLREKMNMDVRGEAYNFSNTPQFSNPSNSITSSTFGQITSARSSGTGVNGVGGGRLIQGAVKITF